MCSRKLLLAWVLLLPCLSLFGEVTEQERQKAQEALTNIEGFTKVLQANSEQRELYYQQTENSLLQRENNLSKREQDSLLKEEQLRQKESSLESRESSLEVTTRLTEESKKLYEQAEKRLKATSFWLKLGILGAGVGGFLLGGLGR